MLVMFTENAVIDFCKQNYILNVLEVIALIRVKFKVLTVFLCLLVSVMVVSVNGFPVFAEEENCQPKFEGEEVVTARTEYTKVFRKNSSTLLTYVSLTPLHYKDKEGEWRDIDTSLQESTFEAD